MKPWVQAGIFFSLMTCACIWGNYLLPAEPTQAFELSWLQHNHETRITMSDFWTAVLFTVGGVPLSFFTMWAFSAFRSSKA